MLAWTEGGGTIISAGIDDDGDSVLDADEVDEVHVVCDGADGAAGADGEDGVDGTDGSGAIVCVVRADALASCPGGGTVVEAGVDDDGDGVLDGDEVDSSAELCDGAAGPAGEDGASGEGGGCAAQAPVPWPVLALGAFLRRRRLACA